jgi:hypothetical protein
MASTGAGTSKMVEKLAKTVEAGQYYEAQQMYKSVQARCVFTCRLPSDFSSNGP